MTKTKTGIQRARSVTIIGAFVNLFLAIFKAVAGFVFGSQALIADAVDSTGDLLTDAVTLVAIRFSRKPIDQTHPYGHGRIESLASMFVGGMLLLAAGTIAFHAVKALISGDFNAVHPLAIGVSLFTLVVKEFLFRWTLRTARELRSRAMEANAWHHRSDAMTSVAVLIGLTGSVLIPGAEFLDALASLVVVGFIIRMAIVISLRSAHDLVDTAQDPELVRESKRIALDVDAVVNAHRIRTRRYGHLSYLDIDIEVDPEMTVQQAHDVAHEVKERILREIEYVADVQAHVEPEGSHLDGEGTVRGMHEEDKPDDGDKPKE